MPLLLHEHKLNTFVVLAGLFGLLCAGTAAEPLVCAPWTAVDGLGRPVATGEECGEPRPEKFVGIFYFLWLGEHKQQGPHNITQILEQPASQREWGDKDIFHWWDEPRFGYYLSDDEWVIAKHAQLLTDAGVDVVFFDVTNGFTYQKEYMTLCRVYRELRDKGRRTPQISFLFNSKARQTTLQVFENFYRKNLYPELWFRWKGKPLILTIPEEMPEEIREFFTIRRSWAWSHAQWFGVGYNRWPWLDHTPQAYGWHEDPTVPEFVPVASAEHPISGIGRSYRDGKQPPPKKQDAGVGTYFQEQWDHALEVDPEFIFITGWNEWVAQRFIADRARRLGDEQIDAGETLFIDQYNREYSRDLEPMRGGFEDHYYYQMASNIRRFKGVQPLPKASRTYPISVDGDLVDWAEVQPEFKDDVGDTRHRDHPGFAEAGPYRNTWGRNDIVSSKVARGDGHLYFLVRTAAPLTPREAGDLGWMNLLLFVDGGTYRVIPTGSGLASVSVYRKKEWVTIRKIPCAVGDDFVEIAFPLPDRLGDKKPMVVEFKWLDHFPEPLSMLDFIDHGDTAPNARFRYVFTHEK